MGSKGHFPPQLLLPAPSQFLSLQALSSAAILKHYARKDGRAVSSSKDKMAPQTKTCIEVENSGVAAEKASGLNSVLKHISATRIFLMLITGMLYDGKTSEVAKLSKKKLCHCR